MMVKDTTKTLLLVGGLGAIGYLALTKKEEVTGVITKIVKVPVTEVVKVPEVIMPDLAGIFAGLKFPDVSTIVNYPKEFVETAKETVSATVEKAKDLIPAIPEIPKVDLGVWEAIKGMEWGEKTIEALRTGSAEATERLKETALMKQLEPSFWGDLIAKPFTDLFSFFKGIPEQLAIIPSVEAKEPISTSVSNVVSKVSSSVSSAVETVKTSISETITGVPTQISTLDY